MDNQTYALGAAIIGNMNRLTSVANNVANASTSGYKKDSIVFDSMLFPDQKNNFNMPVDKASVIDFSNGGLKESNNPYDVGIEGEGFFLISTPEGIRYTRNGRFHRNSVNQLVDSSNNPVLSSDGQGIVFESSDKDPLIFSNGSIVVDGSERGVIGVVNFANLHNLKHVGNNYLATNDPASVVENPVMAQSFYEESNVNSVKEMTKLIELQREGDNENDLLNNIYIMQKSVIKAYSKN